MDLVRPAPEHLDSYLEALDRGWDWDVGEDPGGVAGLRSRIESDPRGFLAAMDDPLALGPPITMPDGSTAARIPGLRRWMWDGEYAGSVSLRWQDGTPDLPPTCLGHVGYGVVPWRRRRGYATKALRDVLPLARARGLPYVEIVADAGNVGSQRVIGANGGVPVRTFEKLPVHGGGEALLFRIDLS